MHALLVIPWRAIILLYAILYYILLSNDAILYYILLSNDAILYRSLKVLYTDGSGSTGIPHSF
jgi:hypothetical protein